MSISRRASVIEASKFLLAFFKTLFHCFETLPVLFSDRTEEKKIIKTFKKVIKMPNKNNNSAVLSVLPIN